MPSPISHAVAAVGLGTVFNRPGTPKLVWVAGIACSILPDLDVLGFRFGVHYGDFWGHRGFTHSIVFSALLAGILTAATSWLHSNVRRLALFAYLFFATASHGLLDAMTNGGLGIAFFSPFNDHRYFLPWRPIHVSPIGTSRFYTSRGVTVLASEMLWIWLPTLLLVLLIMALRRGFYLRDERHG
ncbi:MAG TPA: metal-dependent hydrolase [Candidatus Binatia bacterium]|nr:metal-dependent hydrolase [Candidatus Binatia bacterium]